MCSTYATRPNIKANKSARLSIARFSPRSPFFSRGAFTNAQCTLELTARLRKRKNFVRDVRYGTRYCPLEQLLYRYNGLLRRCTIVQRYNCYRITDAYFAFGGKRKKQIEKDKMQKREGIREAWRREVKKEAWVRARGRIRFRYCHCNFLTGCSFWGGLHHRGITYRWLFVRMSPRVIICLVTLHS